ncbi:hypothetical protein SFRURICE_005628 [Spodoptera frugiperda]|uniref:SFRICE_003610 n=1 Tax=Spodoptera frugiperda TaxID=7108 RepID=A0A2H1W7I3_SPOFR|nr:hypothetical protein SFRURICE_005628 [Spodoptera frugiperda]
MPSCDGVHEEFVYEKNDNGVNVLVKSLNGDHKVLLRFTNRTPHEVNVWWRNFEGKKVFYQRLGPGASYDVESYLTHPWEFIDASTGAHYVVDNKRIFRAPSHLVGNPIATNFDITETAPEWEDGRW